MPMAVIFRKYKVFIFYSLSVLLLLFIFLFVFYFFSRYFDNSSITHIDQKKSSLIVASPEIVYPHKKAVLGISDYNKKVTIDLEDSLQKTISKYSKNVSFGVYFIDSNTSIKINSNRTFKFPAMINLIIALSTLERVNKKSLDLNDTIKGIKISNHLKNLFLVKPIYKNSKNDLLEFLGLPYLQKKVNNYGLNNTDIIKQTTTVSDSILLWKNIYTRSYLDDNYTEYLLTLTNSQKELSLFKDYSHYFTLANKIGSSKESSLFLTSDPFVMAVFTEGLSPIQSKILFSRIINIITVNGL